MSVNGVQLRSRSDFERAITLRENMSATLVRTADPVGLLVRGTSRSATVSEDILDLLRSKSAEFAALGAVTVCLGQGRGSMATISHAAFADPGIGHLIMAELSHAPLGSKIEHANLGKVTVKLAAAYKDRLPVLG